MAFQVVTIHGKDPFERGKQHGSAAKELIQKGVCRYQERFEKMITFHGKQYVKRQCGLFHFLKKNMKICWTK